MGHKISKEQIDPGVKDHIMSFVGDIADLETEVNTDIISAVNSLIVDRVDNAENMGKLANAIGEPVTASDSINEVVDKVDELVTSFKSKVLNAGIMYESGDRFKELIAKLEGLVAGEGGNSGIQFAMGEGNWTVSASNWGESNEITIETNIGFIPSYIICKLSRVSVYFSNGSSSQGLNINNVFLSNLSPIDATIFDKYMSYGIPNSDIFIKNITENSFVLAETCTNVSGASSRMSGTLTEWYAIGVGEGQEDNTLLETLKGILTDEQVEVSDEDNMADLIVKVDTEFDEKNNEMSSLNTNITLLNNQINSLTSELAGKVTPAGTAVAGDVLSGKTFINSTGQVVTGSIVNQGAKTFTPSASKQTSEAGYYSSVTVNTDSNLVAANIVSGKTIFGVAGSATISSLGGAPKINVTVGSKGAYSLGTIAEYKEYTECCPWTCPFAGSVQYYFSIEDGTSTSLFSCYIRQYRNNNLIFTSNEIRNQGAADATASCNISNLLPGDILKLYVLTRKNAIVTVKWNFS